eukprot:comp19468_c0_seq1/m.22664 comp19468_c0_seq1/g.22664  ORF comp19468_c0_seq1/g.22664 comp19468_c0_seq1/m.22664 type:complete len:310 (-) comp19468_c0_seq1:167-1096(-)
MAASPAGASEGPGSVPSALANAVKLNTENEKAPGRDFVKAGYLLKRSDILGAQIWHKRLFVLKDQSIGVQPVLEYYKGDVITAIPSGSIRLTGAALDMMTDKEREAMKKETVRDPAKKEVHLFKLVTEKKKVYHLCAASGDDRSAWIKAILSAINRVDEGICSPVPRRHSQHIHTPQRKPLALVFNDPELQGLSKSNTSLPEISENTTEDALSKDPSEIDYNSLPLHLLEKLLQELNERELKECDAIMSRTKDEKRRLITALTDLVTEESGGFDKPMSPPRQSQSSPRLSSPKLVPQQKLPPTKRGSRP